MGSSSGTEAGGRFAKLGDALRRLDAAAGKLLLLPLTMPGKLLGKPVPPAAATGKLPMAGELPSVIGAKPGMLLLSWMWVAPVRWGMEKGAGVC